MKTLFILIGPKGAGKTYIGTLVNKHLDIEFLRVEPIWVAHLKSGLKERSGWEVVEAEIDRLFQDHDKVIIESLGAGEEFTKFHKSLMSKYQVKLIKVETELDSCLERVRGRNRTDHIPISDDKVEEYNKIASQVTYDWDLVIDNNSLASDSEIIEAMRSINLNDHPPT